MNSKEKIIINMIGQGISMTGSSVVSHAIMWYVTLKTSSSLLVSLVTLSTFLPQALTLPLGGIIADRFNPKKVTMLFDGLIACITTLLSILFFTGHDSVWILLILNCLRSLFAGIELPSAKSLLPMIVDEDMLYKANSAFTGVYCLTQIISPGLSGLALAIFPMAAVFLIDVITAIIGITLLLVISINYKKSSQAQAPLHFINETKEGISYIHKKPALSSAIILYGLFAFLTAPLGELAPLLASENLGKDILILTIVEIAFSIGSLILSIIMSVKELPIRFVTMVRLAAVLFGTTAILLSITKILPLFLSLRLIMGFASPLYYTPLTTTAQSVSDDAHLGRVLSYMDILQTLFIPLGMFFSGVLANIHIVVPFIVTGTLLLLLTILPIMRTYANNCQLKQED